MSLRFFNVVVWLLLSFTVQAFAQSVPQIFDREAETRLYQRLTAEIEEQNYAPEGFFDEIPDGLSTKDIEPKCDPRRFEDSIIGKKLSTSDYFARLQRYFSICQRELTKNSPKGLWGLLKFSRFIYPFLSHPQVSEFLVKLPDGTKVPGVLALKNDTRPRPLVIVKCGVFCSAAQTASVKNYLMHLFDQSPFNVLILANQTGMDYIYHNKRISIGGWTEGYEVLQVGKWMQEEWEHRNRISSIHLMGISLGGNAAVFGASYNDIYRLQNGKKVFNSVTAICPVVSLKPTLEKLYDGLLVGKVFATTTKEHFLEAKKYIKDVPDLISEETLPKNRRAYPALIGQLAAESMSRRGYNIDGVTFLKKNNFWNLPSVIETPMLVWASRDDSVVSNRLNAQTIQYDDRYEQLPNVGILNLKYGQHCGFSSVYGAQASAAVLRTFVLQHSPEFMEDYAKKRTLSWPLKFPKLPSEYEHVGQTWVFQKGSKEVKVSFRIFNWLADSECGELGPWASSIKCTQSWDYKVPISSLATMGARVPRTDAEAQALTREFNTKVEFRITGHPLNGTNSDKFFMSWRNYFE